MDAKALSTLAGQTQEVYERQAAWFAGHRPKTLVEKPWLDRFMALLPENAHILDLGCGAGDPIAGYFMQQGHEVTGVDAAPTMIDLARATFPTGNWQVADMRGLALAQRFDGIIAWNSFFHLTRAEQRMVLPRIAAHLRPTGALMLTVGPEDGEAAGHVNTDAVYHASLAPDAYRSLLGRLEIDVLSFLPEDPECNGQTVLLAQRRGHTP